MFFNSIDFAIFLPVVFLVYWAFKQNLKLQNIVLVLSSYIFYGWWDWRFLGLIFLSTIVDYTVAIFLQRTIENRKRKLLLFASLFVNLGLLGFLKYYNFFTENFVNVFTLFGSDFKLSSLNIILPVGISFYTFQTLSYTIDIYGGKIKATRDFIQFSAFVSFFPQLVAGPIERAKNLLPQFSVKRTFNYNRAVDGLRQILWGLFKKMVIADNCAIMVDDIFLNESVYPGSVKLLGAFLFSVQIYSDFSGYSDIAIGTARLFGFNLMKNFSFPYFSRDIAEFWRRWHISLSTWFRDYLYIPLGGSRVAKWKIIRNVFIVFVVSGFWHGANWTFIVWGFLNALFFLPLILINKNRIHLDVVAKNKISPSLKELLQVLFTFSLVTLTWVFFRSNSISQAIYFINDIFSESLFRYPAFETQRFVSSQLGLIALFFIIEWIGREREYAIETLLFSQPKWMRYAFYYSIVACIFYFHANQQQFIYFQF